MREKYASDIENLFSFILEYYELSANPVPYLFIKHNERLDSVKWHRKPGQFKEQIAIEGNFEQIQTQKDGFYFASLMEISRMESNSWVLTEKVAPYWRSLGSLVRSDNPVTIAQLRKNYPHAIESIEK